MRADQTAPAPVIPLDRCQRCIAPLDGEVYRAERDRVCGVCADRAEQRGEPIARVECAVCLDLPLRPTTGPDGTLITGHCGACTPLPESVLDELG